MFVMPFSERPEENEVPSQIGGKFRVPGSRTDRPSEDLLDRIGI